MEDDDDIVFYSPPEKQQNKRKANDESLDPAGEIRAQLEELSYQKKKPRQHNLEDYNKDQESSSQVTVKLGSNKSKSSNIQEETKSLVPTEKDKPILWINKLRYYPLNDFLPNMVAFREILFEDLLKNNPKNPKRTLEVAFMTTYGYNFELIEPLVKTDVKVVLANEWSKPSEPKIERNLHDYPNLTLIRPPKDPQMNFRGAFHPKLWVFKFTDFLRVVVCTGNLTAGDWIIWSNGMWFKDFPKKSTMKEIPKKKPINLEDEFDFDEDFKRTLKHFLQSMMPIKIDYATFLDFNLDDYYISGIDIVLVPSLPGRFRDGDFDRYGHRRIGAVVKQMLSKPTKPKKWVVTYQTSSMGSLNEKYVKEFLSSILPNYISLEQLKAESKYKGGITPSGDTLFKRLRIVYPTKDYVENCTEGPAYAGCLLLNSENFSKPNFPKNVFYQFQGPDNYIHHEGLIAHIKVFIVTDESGEIDDDTFIYFGSHNFSPSAWGRYEKDYSQFTIGHTELGVLVPPMKGSKERKMELVRNLPFKFPADKYRFDQVPWMSDIHFETTE